MIELIEQQGGIINFIAFCPHTPEEKCTCRKPETGLLKSIEKHLDFSLKGSYFVGDKASDFICAKRHGCIPLLVKTGYGGENLNSSFSPPKNHCFKNLSFAVDYILSR